MRVPPLFQIVRYYSIGALSVIIDVSLYQLLIYAHAMPPLAAAISGPIAAAVHFTFNRVWSFSAFHRSALAQVPAYIFVYSWVWAITVAIVAYASDGLHYPPLAAKAMAISITLPIGFLGHKYLTYGRGLRAGASDVCARLAVWFRSGKAVIPSVLVADAVSLLCTFPLARYSLQVAADPSASAGEIALLLGANAALLCFVLTALLMNASLISRVARRFGARER